MTSTEEDRNTRNKFLVISLDNPVRQGQQRYHHLVVQLANEVGTINMAMNEEQVDSHSLLSA